MKRSRLKPKRTSPRQRAAPRWTVEDWQDATMLLLVRSGGCCEKCGHALVNQLERHHRQRREVGGDRLSNLLALHSRCHQHITEHPEESREQGWIVSANGRIGGAPDPALIPVRLPDGQFWFLHDDGTKIRDT